MSRRSLRPQLNQIRGWVRQGRTDAWIAHQLEVTVQQIQSFKRENELEADGDTAGEPFEEVDLRAEDDAAIAAELEAEAARRAEEEAKLAEEAAKRAAEEDAEPDAGRRRREARAPQARPPQRRRTRRRDDATGSFEGTFDHGEEGYGLWLDPAVEDNPTYAEHWAGHRPVEVTIEEDQIVIRRASGGDERLSSRACAHTAGRCSSAPPAGPSRSRTARPTSRPRIRRSGTSTCCVVDDASGLSAEVLLAEAERLQAPAGPAPPQDRGPQRAATRSSRASRRRAGAPERRGRDAAAPRRRPARRGARRRCARSSSRPCAA